MTVGLIVPINLRALCVGRKDHGTTGFADIAPAFGQMPYLVEENGKRVAQQAGANLGTAVLPPLFQEAVCPEKGIHLHWSLPDALARGVTGADGTVQIPAAPNRWLVIRIASNCTDSAKLKAWVVESDRLWEKSHHDAGPTPNQRSRAYPLASPLAVGKPFQNLGRVFDFDGWSETGEGPFSKPHTMLGYGDLAFASYVHAPNCFGMWDDMEGLDPELSTISYLVAGWYADSAEDPLVAAVPAGASADVARGALEEHLSWTFADDTNKSVPNCTVCSGLLTGIDWDPAGSFLQQPSGAIDVAVGNTAAEALSAMLAAKIPADPTLERALNALQLGLLGNSAPTIEVDERLHQTRFASTTGGWIWVIRPGEGGAMPAVGALLEELNGAQGDLDSLQARIAAYQSQIFADWCKYMELQYDSSSEQANADADAARSYIGSTLIAELTDLTDTELANQTAKVASKQAAVEALLADGQVLHRVAAPRYWAAHDPVVLLWGADFFSQAYRPLTDRCTDDLDNLRCRLSTQLVESLTLASPARAVTPAQLPALSSALEHGADISGLVAEAFLLDVNQVALIAAAAGGSTYAKAVADAQFRLLNGGDPAALGFSGLAPAPVAVQAWAMPQPWLPLLLVWEADYYPAAPVTEQSPDYSPDFIKNGYRLDADAVDLVDARPPPARWPLVEVYQGITSLARNTGGDIATRIDAYLAQHPDDGHASAFKSIGEMGPLPTMAQTLGGFNAALLMLRQTLQLPVRDPLAQLGGEPRDEFSNVTVPGAVAGQSSIAALPHNSYNPLRAGWAQLTRIWVVDVFGRKREIDPENVIRAESLVQPDNSALIRLPPRITQPTRLLLRWLSADDPDVEMNADPATSPICGWVLYNHLVKGLAIYDASGAMLGSLNLEGRSWTGPPGRSFGLSINESLEGVNAGLSDFVYAVYDHPSGVDFLADLIRTIDRALALIEPQGADHYGGLSALLSRPLAVTRLSLGLAVKGMPALHQGFRPFKSAAAAALPMEQRFDASFTSVRVPIRLGELANLSDGLVGYFCADRATFYAPASHGGGPGVAAPEPNTLAPAIGDAPTILLTLLDPRAPLHATVGLLPVKDIQIPPYMFADAMSSLAVTFLTSPLLAQGDAKLALPLPAIKGADWRWIAQEPGETSWSELPVGAANPGAAGFSTQQLREGWLKLSPRKAE